MKYLFNPHRHVKIWLSKEPDSFLNIENQLRFIRFRNMCSKDEINFVFDGALLSASATANLSLFCKKHNIIPHDVNLDIVKKSQTREELQLVRLYQLEIASLKQGGNLGAASDILRWLKPIYSLGTYTDFDVLVNTSRLPDIIETEASILFSLKANNQISDIQSVDLNIDKISIVDCDAALPFIQKIQQRIYRSSSIVQDSSSPYMDYIIASKDSERRLLSPILGARIDLQDSPEVVSLRQLHRLSIGKSALSLRKSIIEFTENNLRFTGFIRESFKVEKHPDTIKVFEYILPKLQSHSLQELADDKIFSLARINFRQNLLMKNVIHTSGTAPVLLSMFGKVLYNSVQMAKEIMPFSYTKYQLDGAFYSNNCAVRVDKKLTNDLSWLEKGEQKIAEYEKIAANAASSIQGFWKHHLFWKSNFSHNPLINRIKAICTNQQLLTALSNHNYALALRKASSELWMPIVILLLDYKQNRGIQFNINDSSSNGNTALDWVRKAKPKNQIDAEAQARIIEVLKAQGALESRQISESACHSAP